MNSDAEKQPAPGALSGKTVFAAASVKLLPELTAGLRALGADVLPVSVLEAKEIEDNAELDRAIANVNQYDWIIFTSAWGVSYFTKRLAQANSAGFLPATSENPGFCVTLSRQNAHLPCVNSAFVSVASLDSEVFRGCLPKICVIGPATAATAKKYGFPITLTADEFTAEGVLQSMEQYYEGVKNMRGLGILIPRALEAREFLPAALRSAGCRVDTIPCYQTVRPEPDSELSARLRKKTPDLIVFTSAKAIRNYLKTAAAVVGEPAARSSLRDTAAAVIGPVTAAALKSEGKSAEIIPAENTVSALLEAITVFFKTG